MQWLKHHTVVSCFHKIKGHILQDIWLLCNTSLIEVASVLCSTISIQRLMTVLVEEVSVGGLCTFVLLRACWLQLITWSCLLSTTRTKRKILITFAKALVTLPHLSFRKNHSFTSLPCYHTITFCKAHLISHKLELIFYYTSLTSANITWPNLWK